MLTTSATRSPGITTETMAFLEQRLLRDLERRRRAIEMSSERRVGRATQPVGDETFGRRLVRGVRAFVQAVRVSAPVDDDGPSVTAVHR